MTQMTAATPNINAGDRLSLTLFLAAAVHAVLILGITFRPADPAKLTPPNALEIILVQQQDSTKPQQADYLAQTSQTGGGESLERDRPSSPFTSTEFADTEGMAPHPMQGGQRIDSPNPVLSQMHAQNQIAQQEQQNPNKTQQTLKQDADYDLEIARLTAELALAREAYAKRPKKMVLTANTFEFIPAQYLHDWTNRIERIGNLNYPTRARRERLKGSLMLEVELKWDGSVIEINLLESSGHALLDEAAKRIVKLAGPFEPFPPELRALADHLEIVRTWQFSNSGLDTR